MVRGSDLLPVSTPGGGCCFCFTVENSSVSFARPPRPPRSPEECGEDDGTETGGHFSSPLSSVPLSFSLYPPRRRKALK